MAVSALMSKRVSRIILTRPAVEAGERLGFLPGTLQEKVDPYLRPLYDALHDMLELDKVEKLLERSIIEVAPIAFMRYRLPKLASFRCAIDQRSSAIGVSALTRSSTSSRW